MKVVIAIDSFKGSLSSKELAKSIKKGIKRVYQDIKIESFLIADGGEGSLEIFKKGAKTISLQINNPLGIKIRSYYLKTGKHSAIIESAKAIGLTSKTKKKLLKTSSFGLGELINDAISKGARDITITIGGTATNDAGAGMLEALGYRFYDKNGKIISPNSSNLINISKIDDTRTSKRLKDISFKVAVDVDAVMVGKRGCSKVFSPQKGATKKDVKLLEKGIENFCKILEKFTGKNVSKIDGTGAGGCIPGALKALFDAKIISGIELMLKAQNFEKAIKKCDLIITGEGKIDSQTDMGKAIYGVAKMAKKHSKPVIALCAIIDDKLENIHSMGINTVFSILDKPLSKNRSLKSKRTKKMVKNITQEIFELIKTIKNGSRIVWHKNI